MTRRTAEYEGVDPPDANGRRAYVRWSIEVDGQEVSLLGGRYPEESGLHLPPRAARQMAIDVLNATGGRPSVREVAESRQRLHRLERTR